MNPLQKVVSFKSLTYIRSLTILCLYYAIYTTFALLL